MRHMDFVCSRSLIKPVAFGGITFIIYLVYLKGSIQIVGNGTGTRAYTGRHNTTNLSSHQSFPSKATENTSRTGRKVFIAFYYWEQLTQATNSFQYLTALAAISGRQVVVPFVKDSSFYGSAGEEGRETLSLYYNVSALNHTLRSRGYGTLVSWKEFQRLCKGRLDVLVRFEYKNVTDATAAYRQAKRESFQCQDGHKSTYKHLKVGRTVCMNVFAIDSVHKFENEVLDRVPCVGFAQWRGIDVKSKYRAQFQLGQFSKPSFQSSFSPKLLQVARDFIARNLGPRFLSVHIRTEKILKMKGAITDIASVKKCLSTLTVQIQSMRNISKASSPIFVATDFAAFGSSSWRGRPARKKAKSLMKILAPLNAINFQPSVYNLTDKGAVAIVEMNILASAEHLWILGGGSFQGWIVKQFFNNRKIDRRNTVNCKNEMCNRLCYF